MANKQLKLENVDYLWASVYLACTMTPEQVTRERMNDCVPDRKHRSGQKPKVGSMRKKNSHEKLVWREDPAKFKYGQKKRILARVVQTLIETTFNTHVYKWAGKVYKQRKGGPIGLRASGSLAKAAMEDWI